MDIWQWLREVDASLRADGNTRLADLIDKVSNAVTSGQPQGGQAVLPEALAGARALGNSWLEVYFRHWVLNGRVQRIKEGETAYPEALELFTLAQRPENRACPQSVCAAQDLASCYGTVDSKGLAAERIALCRETLDRIDPSWSCFNCLTGELVEALVDDGRGREALELAERLVAQPHEGRQPTVTEFLVLARARLAAGAYADALALLDFRDSKGIALGNDSQHFLRSCLLVRTFAALGEFDLAWSWRPSEHVAEYHGGSQELVAGLFAVCSAQPHRNTYGMGRRVAATLRHFCKVGAHRLALDTLPYVVRLAVARGSSWSANLALTLARPHLLMLRAPHGAPELFAELEALVGAMPTIGLPVPATQLLQHLGLPREYEPYYYAELRDNPEQDLAYLLLAAAELPAEAAVANAIAAAMRACGAPQEARDYLWVFVRAHPEQDEAVTNLLDDLLCSSIVTGQVRTDHGAARQLAEFLAQHNLTMSYWCHARTAANQRRWSEVGDYAALLVGLDQTDHRARTMWAAAALRAMQFDTALQVAQELAEVEVDGDNRHWRIIVAASALQRWEVVCAACAKLESPFQAREPDDEPEMIEVARCEDGSFKSWEARRTGPAIARITTIANDGGRQRVGDLVVFDPNPEFQRNDEDYPLRSYDLVHVLEEGGYGDYHVVSGVHPGEERFSVLTAALDAMEWAWTVTGTFRCDVSDNGQKLPGLYFILAAPASITPAMIDAKLGELTVGLAHPMCWFELAEEACVDTQWHREVEERYGF